MGCCKSTESSTPEAVTSKEQSLLVADHGAGALQESVQDIPTNYGKPEHGGNEDINTLKNLERPLSSSLQPVNGSPLENPLVKGGIVAKSPADSSVASWEGDAGAGIWRVCDGDLSPNPLNSIQEEKTGQEEVTNTAVNTPSNGTIDGASPFFRSVASAEMTPSPQPPQPPKKHVQAGKNDSAPSVMQSIMQEETTEIGGGNSIEEQFATPLVDGSPFFRSVSSVSNDGTPIEVNTHFNANSKLALDFDVDQGGD